MFASILLLILFQRTPGIVPSPALPPPPMRGYVMFPDQDQRKAVGIEVRLVRGFPEQFVYSVKTDEGGLFSFPEYLTSLLGSQIPGAPDTLYFYLNLDGYARVMQIARTTMNVIMLHQGPSDTNALPTDYDAPPLTRLEALRKELVAEYSELAVREYEAGLKDSVKHKEDSAIGHYTKAIKYAPAFFDAVLQLGFSYQELKKIAEAEKAFRRSVEIRPNSGEALTALGGVLLDKAAYEEAASVLKRAVARAPWSSQALYFQGSALYKLNQHPEAEAALRDSLVQDHPIQEARLMLVNIFVKQRRYTEALDQLNAYLDAVSDGSQRKAAEQMRTQIQSALKP